MRLTARGPRTAGEAAVILTRAVSRPLFRHTRTNSEET